MSGTPPPVVAHARAEGFQSAGIVDPARAEEYAALIGSLQARRWYERDLAGMELDWVLHPDSWAGTRSILVCALSCHRSEPDDLSTPDDPHALIAPFARRNYYHAAVRMLGRVVGRLEAACGIDAKAVRLFCNSRIPEKPLLSAAGLGRYGANGLAIIPGLGSSFVIAGAVLPVPTRVLAGEIPARIPDDPCGPCDLCIRTCPVGAIVERGLVDPDRCLQGIASREGPLRASIMERWGYRFYGCQECQNVCPHNRGLAETGRVADGEIGPSVSLRKILALDPEGVESLFRGTTMGMSWISGAALLRNALVAAGNRKDPALSPLIAHHVSSGEAGIRDAAEWALGRI